MSQISHEDRVLEILQKSGCPCYTAPEIASFIGCYSNEIMDVLNQLETSGMIEQRREKSGESLFHALDYGQRLIRKTIIIKK